MTVVAVVLALALVSSMGVNAWLLHGRIADKDKAADARIAQTFTEAESERQAFELEQTKQALAAADHVIDGLEETLASYLNHSTVGDGLAADDVDGRVLRLARRLGQAARAGRVPAEPAEAVPPGPAAGAANADLRDPGGPDV